MKIIKKMYDWVLHWAKTPYAVPALFLLSFAESSFFPVPPDVLLIALAISIPKKAFKYATICMVGSVLGGVLGYGIGLYGYEMVGKPIVEFYHGQEIMDMIKLQYDQHGFLGILIAAITPPSRTRSSRSLPASLSSTSGRSLLRLSLVGAPAFLLLPDLSGSLGLPYVTS